MSWRWALAWLGFSIAGPMTLACSPANGPAAVPASKPAAPPVHEGPLTDYVPAAGLRWLVVGRPRDVAKDPALREAVSLLVPDERRAVFARSSGVELDQTPNALVGGFDQATLYMAELSETRRVEERFIGRLIAGPTTKQPHPRVRSTVGVVGETPEGLLALDGRLVAVSVGSTLPAKIAGLYALGRLPKSPPALEGAALSTLPVAELERAPLRFYAPGPFLGEWARGARGLLAVTVAVGMAFSPTADGKLSATVVLSGDYRSLEGDPADVLASAWQDLAVSSLGRLLGLDRPAAEPKVAGTPESLRLSVVVDPLPLARGLRAAVMAEVWEILRLEPPAADSPGSP